MKNDKKERKKAAGGFSIFICAAEKRGHIPDGIRHITNDRACSMVQNMKQILIIDDDSINLRMAEFILKDRYETVCISSGHRGLDFLSKNIPDLILLDLHMPEMDGLEVLEQIKGMESLSKVPVIFLTADDDGDTEWKLLQAGAAGYIQKPFLAEALLEKIKQTIENAG